MIQFSKQSIAYFFVPIAVSVATGWFLIGKVKQTDKEIADNSIFSPFVYQKQTDSVETIDTSNWKTYRNEEYGFEVKYPQSFFDVKEFRGNDDSFAVDFIQKGKAYDDPGKMGFTFYRLISEKDIFAEKIQKCEQITVSQKKSDFCYEKKSFEKSKQNFDSIVEKGICLENGFSFSVSLYNFSYSDKNRSDSFHMYCDDNPLTGKVFQKMYQSIRFFS